MPSSDRPPSSPVCRNPDRAGRHGAVQSWNSARGCTNLSVAESGKGSGRSNKVFTTLNTATLTPMPRARTENGNGGEAGIVAKVAEV